MNHTSLLISLALALPALAHATTGDVVLPEQKVIVSALASSYPVSGDTAQMLGNLPGYGVAAGGGVSGLPVVNGFADDRLKIRIDGMEITSACAKHMNAPLSYITPSQVQRIRLIAGVTPVSAGGDSIAGTIEVHSNATVFAAPGARLLTQGSFGLLGRSVNNGVATNVTASAASETLSVGYSGAYTRSRSYEDGHGDKVLGSMVESINQSIVLAAKGDGQQLTLRAVVQHILYQGFPNQYMDMTDNHGQFANLAYQGMFGWGVLDARLYWQQTDHEMGFFSSERPGTMPMITHGKNTGYALAASLPTRVGELRLGHEFHAFRLDDYWPAVPGSMMMGPRTYLNLNDGKRDRAVLFGEVEWQAPQAASPRWGKFTATGNAAWTRGKRSDSDGGADLYRMMPLNALLGIEHAIGAWSNRLEARLVARKDKLDARRLELGTGGYAIVNLRSQVALNKMTSMNFGMSNPLNRAYADPLAGVYLSGLPAEGRSFDVGLQLKF